MTAAHHSLRAITCAGLAVMALAAQPAHADPVVHAFKATITTTETIGFDLADCPLPPFLQGTTRGTGTAQGIGNVELQSTDCLAPGPGSFTFTHGKLVLKASNGDELQADYAGSLAPNLFSPIGTLSGSFRVTGGTGRFANATGAGYLSGSENLKTLKGTFVATGTVTY